ncbi:MAG: hypothetical protein WC942_03465 [Clostridia bacterium]|jgi:hypothetical protein
MPKLIISFEIQIPFETLGSKHTDAKAAVFFKRRIKESIDTLYDEDKTIPIYFSDDENKTVEYLSQKISIKMNSWHTEGC